MSRQTLINEIKYLNDLIDHEYLVNEDWLVCSAYERLVTGQLSFEDFLKEAIRDIYSEVKYNWYGTISGESKEKFFKDSKVKKIAKKYNIELL